MHLTLIPIRGLPGQPGSVLAVAGETLTIDGASYALAAVPEGGEALPEGAGHPFVGAISRRNGQICCALRVVLGDDAAPDQPGTPWVVTATEGVVAIPAIRLGEPAA